MTEESKPGLSRSDRVILAAAGTAVAALILSLALLWIYPLLSTRMGAFGAIITSAFPSMAAVLLFLCSVVTPGTLVQAMLWGAQTFVYRAEALGAENIPSEGGAVLLSNHVRRVDFLAILAVSRRPVRFIMFREYYDSLLFRLIGHSLGFLPVSRRDTARRVAMCLKEAHEALDNGELVCIFPEGGITRTGYTCRFLRGFEHLLRGTEYPIIPVYVDWLQRGVSAQPNAYKVRPGLWGLFQHATAAFGKPLPPDTTAPAARAAVCELGAEAVLLRKKHYATLPHIFISQARKMGGRFLCSDSTGKELSYRKAFITSIALADIFAEECKDEEMVGIMLPSTVAGVVANTALMLAGKIPINLNFTASSQAVASAIERCNIRTIITADSFLEKAGIERLDGMLPLESVAPRISTGRKLLAAAKALLLPQFILKQMYGGDPSPERLATIMFSSGSTGIPKGVMLTHSNILSNIDSTVHVFPLDKEEVLCGILPFFHSFGFTVTLWLPIVTGVSVAYHPNPVDARVIGELVEEKGCTLLISTPTFLRTYIRVCDPDEFGSLKSVIVGAEKLKREVAEAFHEKFGVRPMEGYGVTETSPVISLNVEHYRSRGVLQKGNLEGSVGRPIPGLAVKTIDTDTGEDLPRGEQGVLCIKGGSVMEGYFGEPERTASVLKNGWYETGDVAVINPEGFITIVDRISRFSKIGGEMVPHIAIENKLTEILGTDGSTAVVTGIPDRERGERLVVVHLEFDRPIEEVWEHLNSSDLPKLYVPRKDSFLKVEEIPVLGTGKIALKQVREIASERLLSL